MLEFPYMRLPGGIIRPIIAVGVEGSGGRRLLDGLVDTGADRTIFPRREAVVIGATLPIAPDGTFKTAGGVTIAYRLAEVILELRAPGTTIRWNSQVAFADEPLSIIHLGHRGFLEFFDCLFRGPERNLALIPRSNLPVA